MENYSELVEKIVDQSTDWRSRHAAFTGLVRQFQDMAYAYALGRLGDAHLAEDAAQESFITVWQQIEKLRDAATFPLWLKRIVATHCHRLTRRPQVDTVPLNTIEMIAGSDTPSSLLDQSEMWSEVQREVARLGENERIALTLFSMGDYSYDDLADFLGVPLSTVKKRLYSARRRLRERMLTPMLTDALQSKRPSSDGEFVRRIELFTAIKAGDVDTVRAALAELPQLAESTMTDGYGITAQKALNAAIVAGHQPVVDALLTSGAKPTEGDVHDASQRGHRAMAKTLIDAGGIDDTLTNVSPDTASLLKAVHAGATDEITELIDRAGVDAIDTRGRSPLMIAAASGFVDIARILIDRGSNVNAVDNDAMDAVHHAVRSANWCWAGHAEVAELLVAAGAPCDIWTAARGGVVSLVKQKVEADPHLINAENDRGETPLEIAVGSMTKFSNDIIEYLREKKPVLNIYMACQFGDIDRARELLAADPALASAPRSSSNDNCAVHYSARNWCPQDVAAQIIDLLADYGADVDVAAGPFGWTPLHACAEWWNDTLIAGAILRHGANVNARSAQGWTPLRYATALGRNEMAAFLRTHGGEE